MVRHTDSSASPGSGFCFVHAADLHLDTPFKGLSTTNAEVGAMLRDASLSALDNLVQLCIDRSAAFLLIAGDLYDGPERGVRAQLRLRSGLQRLSDAGIETFIVHGNHDPVNEGWSAIGTWPERVHVFAPDHVEAVEVDRSGETIAVVQGISYATREMTENLALKFAPRKSGPLQIGLLHCNVAGAPDGHAHYSPCAIADLHRIGLDYWALGHVHQRSVMSGTPFGDEPFVVYPGNLQARSPKPSERGPKGATVVEVRGGKIAGVEAVSCDVVRFAEICVDTTFCESIAEIHERLVSIATERLNEGEGRSLVLRCRLEGRTECHGQLANPQARTELLSSLREEGTDRTPFVWWDRLEDATQSLLDLDQARSAGDFVADLLDTADELCGAGRAPALSLTNEDLLPSEVVEELVGRLPSELRRRAETVLAALPPTAFVDAAARLAIDHLEVPA